MINQIAFLSANAGSGGASRAVTRLLRGLSQCKLESIHCTLISYAKSNSEYDVALPSLSSNYVIKLIQKKELLLTAARSFMTSLWEAKTLDASKAQQFYRSGTDLDCSVENSLRNYSLAHLFWCQAYLDLHKISFFKGPIVITLHDMWFLTGGCTYSLDCQGFISDCAACPNVQSKSRGSLQAQFELKRAILNRPNSHLIVTSRWMHSQVIKSGISPEKISIIPNFIPDHYAYYAAEMSFRELMGLKRSADKVVLYFVGSLSDKRKGFDLLVQSFQLLPCSQLRKIHLQILGSPSLIIRALDSIGVNYTSLGYYQDEISQVAAYNAADFLICPSYFDNSPNVVAEALCCGLPALALPDTGGAEMILHGRNGLVPNNQTPQALADSILDICMQKHCFNKKIIAQEARQCYGYDATCKKHVELYLRLL